MECTLSIKWLSYAIGIPLGFIHLKTQGYNGHGAMTGVQNTVTRTKQVFTFTSILIQGKYRAFQVNNIT